MEPKSNYLIKIFSIYQIITTKKDKIATTKKFRPVAPTSKAVVANCLYFNGTWE